MGIFTGKTILMIGASDTKGTEHAFLREQIFLRGNLVLAVNTGVLGTKDRFPVGVEAAQVAKAVEMMLVLIAGRSK